MPQEIARQVGLFVHQDRLDDFHRLVVVWCLAVVELQHPTQIFSLFAADYTIGLTDKSIAGSVAHFNAEILWLVSFAQNTVTVNPVVFNIVDIVSNQEEISSMDELPIAYVRKELWLRKGDIFFPFNHKYYCL